MSTLRHYCTLFDSNYLLKGLVMLQTLRKWCPSAQVHVLCMDEVSHALLNRMALPGVSLLTLEMVEDEDLLRVKPRRTVPEYCWTLTASLCQYVMRTQEEIDLLTYLDADLMFFSEVEPLFMEMGEASITVVEHRYIPRLAHLEAYGRFNVEWVSFRRDEEGMHCLNRWREQCIEWCFARLEDGKLGDQKYLDAWPTDYRSVHILRHKGAGVAPWNYQNHQYQEADGKVLVDGTPLVFYHFHQFQLLKGGHYDYMSEVYSAGMAPPDLIYRRYERALEGALALVRDLQPGFSAGIRPGSTVRIRRLIQSLVPVRVKNFLRRMGLHTW